MKNPTKTNLFILLILFLIFGGCKPKIPEITWDYSDSDIVGSRHQKSDKIDIDIYIDATTSMEGFAVDINSDYSRFLDQLEASVLTAWKEADRNFYKFGQRIRPIDHNEFLSAKNDLSFYRENGIFLNTYIDSVVRRTNPERLSVLVTDLFQNEADVNTMVDRIREKCFANGVMVGIIGITSNFNGKVFDVPVYPQGYLLKTNDRPFYAIMFGNPGNMEYLFESLKTLPIVQENYFIMFSPYIVKSYAVKLTKTKEATTVNKLTPKKNISNYFDFSMKKVGKESKFNLEIDLIRNPRCADYRIENLEVVAYKKSSFPGNKTSPAEGVLTNDIKLENLQRSGDKITSTLILNNQDDVGNYSYLVYFKVNELNGLVVPGWIGEYSTENPVINTPSARLTYNLDRFSSRLLVANSTIMPVNIAKFYINIYKR